MGSGIVPQMKLAEFIFKRNPFVDAVFVRELASYYVREAAIEGVNADVAFAQMCLETGYLSYGGLVTPEMNNFAGIGALGNTQRGNYFTTPQIGVRA